jgi:hypothetical protein
LKSKTGRTLLLPFFIFNAQTLQAACKPCSIGMNPALDALRGLSICHLIRELACALESGRCVLQSCVLRTAALGWTCCSRLRGVGVCFYTAVLFFV